MSSYFTRSVAKESLITDMKSNLSTLDKSEKNYQYNKKGNDPFRLLIDVDDQLVFYRKSKENKHVSPDDEYEFLKFITLPDETFLYFFIEKDNFSMEKNLIYNNVATLLVNDPAHPENNNTKQRDMSERISRYLTGTGCEDCGGDCSSLEKEYRCSFNELMKLMRGFVHGAVLLCRMNCDGEEIGVTKKIISSLLKSPYVVELKEDIKQ